MLYRKIFYIAAAALLLASCEKTIKVNLPESPSKLVVNSIANAGEPIYVNISSNFSYSGNGNIYTVLVNNAKASLYVNGAFAQDMIVDSLNNRYTSSVIADTGKHYSVKVTAPGYHEADAEVTAPSYTYITDIKHILNARKNTDGNWQDELDITFTDPAANADYYILSIQAPADTTSGWQYRGDFCVNSFDESVETNTQDIIDANTCINNQNIFIRDALFNGRQKVFRFFIDADKLAPLITFTGDTIWARGDLSHVPEALFRYKKSLSIAQESNSDPFAEPTNVYTNVSSGYGIFAVEAKTYFVIK